MQLPDGKIIKIGRERFEAAEAMFRPEMAGITGGGAANMIFDTIMSSDMDLRLEVHYEHSMYEHSMSEQHAYGVPSKLASPDLIKKMRNGM